MPTRRPTQARQIVCGAALLLSLGLGGCGSMVADLPLVGLPADAPARRERGEFLPVNALPPGTREDTAMAPAEQTRLQTELAAARERQATAAAAAAAANASVAPPGR